MLSSYLSTEIMSMDMMLQRVKRYYPQDNVDLIEKAYYFAQNAHKGQKRKNGEDYFIHPCACASILIELMMDVPTIAAGLLHDTVEDCSDVTSEIIEKEFGAEIAQLVDGVTKLDKLKFPDRESQKAESIRKMILAMSKNVRVVLIKLADRLHNMRTLRFQSPERQKAIAKETLDIYAALAHRMGINSIKSELEDLSFKYLEPDAYRKTADMVGIKRAEREEQIKIIISKLSDKLDELDTHYEIDGRPKHLYSIYRKMTEKGKSFDQIYDIVAVRVLVDTVQDCYAVLGIVHTLWTQMPGRFKDYISVPKANMYQSLHTTLVGGRKIPFPFEIQIRTFDMHKVAEFGIAAHWRYKENKTDKSSLDQKMQWLRSVLDWQKEISDSKEFLSGLKTDLFSEEVLIFTPKGDVITMQRGSTPIDFAYHIHSAIGDHCVGAKVNGKIVPLETELKTGDLVSILTSPSSKGPSLDWLNVIKTQQAKTKIRQFFKHELKEENIVHGREMFEKEIKRRGELVQNIAKPEYFEKLLKRYSFKDLNDIYGAVGYGSIPVVYVVSKLLDEKNIKNPATPLIEEVSHKEVVNKLNNSNQSVFIEGEKGMLVHFARCCNPVPGDEITGFVTHGRGVTIHKSDCVNLLNSDKERLVRADWASVSNITFDACINIVAYDHVSLLADVASCIANMNIPIVASSAKADKKRKLSTITMVVKIAARPQLDKLIKQLQNRNDIVDVYRGNGID